jgi:hypothetical protein
MLAFPASPAGQCLNDVDPARLFDRVREALPIAHRPAVDKDGEMAAQRSLIVEDVTAQPRLVGERGRERFVDGARGDVALGNRDVPLYRCGEKEVRHGRGEEWADIAV